jgi:hypothetical protein
MYDNRINLHTSRRIPREIPTLTMDDGRTEIFLPDYQPRVRPLHNPFAQYHGVIVDAEILPSIPAYMIDGGRV